MLFLIKVALIAALSYAGSLFFPWWIVVVAAFLGGAIIPSKMINSFLSGFLGVGLLWLVFAWLSDMRADSIISDRIAPLFQLGEPAMIILASALIGGIIGGMGALSGDLFKRLFPKKDKDMYR